MSNSLENESISTQVRRFLLAEFLPGVAEAELDDETPLITGGIVDSIATLKLVAFLEESFDIELEAYEVDPDHLDSVSRIAALVAAKQAGGA